MSVMRKEQCDGKYKSGQAGGKNVVFWLLKGHQHPRASATGAAVESKRTDVE